MTSRWRFLVLLALTLIPAGCAPPALLIGSLAAATAGTGTYMYIEGELRNDYDAPFDRVWSACEKTIAQLRGTDVKPEKDIGRGTISAVIMGEKVTIRISYKAKDLSSVAIRVGTLGDRLSSQVIHDRIRENLAK